MPYNDRRREAIPYHILYTRIMGGAGGHTHYTYTVKKVSDFPVPSRDVTYKALPGREKFNYSWPGKVWLVISWLGTGKSLTFFLQCKLHICTILLHSYTYRVLIRARCSIIRNTEKPTFNCILCI
jgi:hypothetical protein